MRYILPFPRACCNQLMNRREAERSLHRLKICWRRVVSNMDAICWGSWEERKTMWHNSNNSGIDFFKILHWPPACLCFHRGLEGKWESLRRQGHFWEEQQQLSHWTTMLYPSSHVWQARKKNHRTQNYTEFSGVGRGLHTGGMLSTKLRSLSRLESLPSTCLTPFNLWPWTFAMFLASCFSNGRNHT